MYVTYRENKDWERLYDTLQDLKSFIKYKEEFVYEI